MINKRQKDRRDEDEKQDDLDCSRVRRGADEFPEVMTKGSCSESDLSISGTWSTLRTRSWSSACSRYCSCRCWMIKWAPGNLVKYFPQRVWQQGSQLQLRQQSESDVSDRCCLRRSGAELDGLRSAVLPWSSVSMNLWWTAEEGSEAWGDDEEMCYLFWG